VSWTSERVIRRLPPPLIRLLCMIDLTLSLVPFWAYFCYCRWTGTRIGLDRFVHIYPRGVRFVLKHAAHSTQGTGPLGTDWLSGPIRRAQLPERHDWANRGSCGTCRNCCTTHWLPPEERLTCPLLSAGGYCGVYAGVWWDYLNCGRYPVEPAFTKYYDCKRFGAPVPSFSPAA
jgi:hypothetical protein